MARKLNQKELATNAETMAHIRKVQTYLNKIVVDLLERGRVHDKSKLEEPELEYFVKYTPDLKGLKYGTEEYIKNLENIAPALDHHYEHNRHHPQFFDNQLEWRPVVIKDFDATGHYEVSDYGDIRSIERTVKRSKQGSYKKAGQKMSYEVTPKGYCRIQLAVDGNKRAFLVHDIVAWAFIPNPDNKPEVNHENGNKRDNRVTNLNWKTSSENQIHAYDTGLKKASIKYAVTCTTLDITTLGCLAMEKALKERGYEKASAAGIWRVINHGGMHLDLEFEGNKFEEWMRSPLSQMNLMDIIELFCDWYASTERTKDGNIRESIHTNAKRFGICDQLVAIMMNTVDMLEEGVE